jgi:hypothetical protein
LCINFVSGSEQLMKLHVSKLSQFWCLHVCGVMITLFNCFQCRENSSWNVRLKVNYLKMASVCKKGLRYCQGFSAIKRGTSFGAVCSWSCR